MVGWTTSWQTLQGQAENQELGQDDHEDEGEIHPEGLSNYSVQEDAELEIEADDNERVYWGILQVEYQGGSSRK